MPTHHSHPLPILPAPVDNAVANVTAPAQKRRGRKPGILSRAARESQRKMNHSRIEKARRLKINDTLTTLRALIPADFGRDLEEDDAEDDARGGQREFKLQVLERTVAYMHFLLQEAQARNCSHCGSSLAVASLSTPELSTSNKRRRVEDNGEAANEDVDVSELSEPEEDEEPEVIVVDNDEPITDAVPNPNPGISSTQASPVVSAYRPSVPPGTPLLLPPISAWINEPLHNHAPPVLSPSEPCLTPSSLVNTSPFLRAISQSQRQVPPLVPTSPLQLPSPPSSGRALTSSYQQEQLEARSRRGHVHSQGSGAQPYDAPGFSRFESSSSGSGTRTGARSASSSLSFPDTPPTLTLPQAQTSSTLMMSSTSERAYFASTSISGVTVSGETHHARSTSGQRRPSPEGRSIKHNNHRGWTCDDQSAASLLLEMTMPRNSPSPPSSSASVISDHTASNHQASPRKLHLYTPANHEHVLEFDQAQTQSQTPGSILGIRIAPRPN